MATFRKRGKNRWEAQVRKKGFPTQTKTLPSRAEAEEWAKLIETRMRQGLYLPAKEAEGTTVAQLAKRFEEEFAEHHYRGQAWKHKLARIREKLGRYTLVALSPKVISDYRDRRLQEPDARYTKNLDEAPRVSPATVKGELDLLSKLLDVATKEFGILVPNGNPVRHIRKPSANGSRERRLVRDEGARLLEQCEASQNPWLRPAVIIALETSMRQGEILSLEWPAIDFKRGLAYLSTSKNGEARAVPLSPAAIQTLKQLGRHKEGKVFPTDRMTLFKAFTRACERASIENLTFHDLRHEALSRLAERGDLSVLELATISGHKTLQMLKRYTHLQAESLSKKLAITN